MEQAPEHRGRVRAFFRFCADREWIEKNPAVILKQAVTSFEPTMPFTDEEMEKIFKACDSYPKKGIYGVGAGARVKAFVLLLRHSGLRIGDAVCLEKERIKDGKLFHCTLKTGTPVWLP